MALRLLSMLGITYVISTAAKRSGEILSLKQATDLTTRFLHFASLRAASVEMTCATAFLLALTTYATITVCAAPAPPVQTAPPTYRLALPGYQYKFPRDHASHPAYRTEWWYYTGHLQAKDGHRFGYQLTFFRHALAPAIPRRASKWATRDVIVGHFALTDETGGKYYCADRISRAAAGLAGAETATPRVWLGSWKLRFTGKSGERQIMSAAETGERGDFAVALETSSAKPPAIHGQNGVSQKTKGRGRASHYYSFTRLATHGTVRLGSATYTVTGLSWFDHEFGSNQLSPEQAGWDWFCLQLDDGRELMLYRLRLKNGSDDPYSSGTLVERDGSTRHLKLNEYRIESKSTWYSKRSKTTYPAGWRVTLPKLGLALDVEPTIADQEMTTDRSTSITYWEGSSHVSGTQSGRAVTGNGYVELTGYAAAFNGTF